MEVLICSNDTLLASRLTTYLNVNSSGDVKQLVGSNLRCVM